MNERWTKSCIDDFFFFLFLKKVLVPWKCKGTIAWVFESAYVIHLPLWCVIMFDFDFASLCFVLLFLFSLSLLIVAVVVSLVVCCLRGCSS